MKPQQQANHYNTPTIRERPQQHNTADNGNKIHAPKITTTKKINKNNPTTGRTQATHHTHRHTTTPAATTTRIRITTPGDDVNAEDRR